MRAGVWLPNSCKYGGDFVMRVRAWGSEAAVA